MVKDSEVIYKIIQDIPMLNEAEKSLVFGYILGMKAASAAK